ncbi:hypothetical protein H6G96_28430 [Nostoc sp. FACHB-892]|uniref:hypothetical protein n=1 Tax=Nostoc sp. FACHB-892 TaxID=2692843 RepID=UPI001681E5CC|nr:hypothetical protein [Nostoc sp. FACHB-892]MBD2730141.1 hypothetical protein [Nostoc sp. FACHB-892]
MIALPGITIQDKIYESSNSLVYRGIRDDGVGVVVKMLKLDVLEVLAFVLESSVDKYTRLTYPD